MDDFHKTAMGRKFFEVTMPRIADGIERLSEAVERQNKLLERQAKPQQSEISPPDSLKELTGAFIGGKGNKFAQPVGRVHIETVLLRWASESPKAIERKNCDKLIELVVHLAVLSRKNAEVNEEEIDARISHWIQFTTLGTDGPSHRELQRLVMWLCRDAVAGSLVVA